MASPSLEERLARYKRTQEDLRASIASRMSARKSTGAGDAAAAETPAAPAERAQTQTRVGAMPPQPQNGQASSAAHSPPPREAKAEGGPVPRAQAKPRAANTLPRTTNAATATTSESSTKPPKILELTVDVGEGRSDVIHVHEGDSVEELAKAFAERNALSPKVVGPLAKHLEGQVKSAVALAATPATPVAVTPRPVAQPQRKSLQTVTPSSNTAVKPRAAHTEMPRTRPLPTGVVRPQRAPAKTTGAAPAGARRRHGKKSRAAVQAIERLYGDYESRERKLNARREELSRKVEAEMSNRVPMSTVSRKLSRGRNAEGFETFHHRLYVEGLEGSKRREELHQRMLKEREEREAATFVGSPAISELAQTMKSASLAIGDNVFDRLSKDNGRIAREARLEAIRREKESHELDECSFAPSINSRSRALAQSLRLEAEHETLTMYRERLEAEGWGAAAAAASIAPLHEQLHEEAEDRARRRQAYEAWRPDGHSFKPAISDASRAIAESLIGVGGEVVAPRASGPGISNSTDIFERLYAEKDAIALRQSEEMSYLARPFDEKTGQPLYKPAVGRSPQYARNSANLEIGDFLYAMRHEFDDKKQLATERELQKIDEKSNMSHLTWRSHVAVDKLKKRRFHQIFRYLSKGRLDGLVDLSNTQLFVRLDPEVRNDLYEMKIRVMKDPLAIEGCTIVGDGEPSVLLNKSAFVRVLGQLVDSGPLAGPRHYLLPSAGRKIQDSSDPNTTFAPFITEESRMLAERRRPLGVPVEDILFAEHEEAQKRLERIADEAEREKMDECTFKPHLWSNTVEGRIAMAKSGVGSTVMSKVAMQRRRDMDRRGMVAQAKKPPPPPSPLEKLRDAVLSGDATRALSGEGARGEVEKPLEVMSEVIARWKDDDDDDEDVRTVKELERIVNDERRRDTHHGANITASTIKEALNFLEDVSSSDDD